MTKALFTLLLGSLPVFALAGGSHAGGHDQEMADMHKDMMGTHQDEHSSAAGKAGDPAQVSRTVAVSMGDDMRFSPSQITVNKGETIRFFVKNSGKMAHEMVIGTTDELTAHAETMRNMPGMQHVESNMVTLAPGKRGGIVWQFDQAGSVDFACLVPGHMEAGMVGKVQVE